MIIRGLIHRQGNWSVAGGCGVAGVAKRSSESDESKSPTGSKFMSWSTDVRSSRDEEEEEKEEERRFLSASSVVQFLHAQAPPGGLI